MKTTFLFREKALEGVTVISVDAAGPRLREGLIHAGIGLALYMKEDGKDGAEDTIIIHRDGLCVNHPFMTTNMAEAIALEKGLDYAQSVDGPVMLLSDSEFVVKTLIGEYPIGAGLKWYPLMQRIAQRYRAMNNCKLWHIAGKLNVEADKMSRQYAELIKESQLYQL